MTYPEYKEPEVETGKVLNFDHVLFWVGDDLQAASFYCTRMGFKPVGYKGLETGCRDVAAHVVQQNQIRLVVLSPYEPGNQELGDQRVKHGDGVKDVALAVDDLDGIVEKAKERGGKIVRDIWTESDQHAYGSVRLATVQTLGDLTHTLVERGSYKGTFLPGYKPSPIANDPLLAQLPKGHLDFVDHVVGNLPDLQMMPVAEWYERVLQLRRFWSVDDSLVDTQYSALRATVVTNDKETVKWLVSEPAHGVKRSQIQEFVDYNGGAGVQHIALYTSDIVSTITNLKARGLQFLTVPATYYTVLRERLKNAAISITEDIDQLEKLNILIDYDEHGYLLQIFTKPMQDRPTLFFEYIQRHNHKRIWSGKYQNIFRGH